MSIFFSWLGSPNGVTLLVSFVALFGLLWTTSKNNKAADYRRLCDQTAADERRRLDQAAADRRRRLDHQAEEDRRKASERAREAERREELQREDYARQRLAVASTLERIMAGAELVNENLTRGVQEDKPFEELRRAKALDLYAFLARASALLALLHMEITHPQVSKRIGRLRDEINDSHARLQAAKDRGVTEFDEHAEAMSPLDQSALEEIVALTEVARLNLLVPPGRFNGA